VARVRVAYELALDRRGLRLRPGARRPGPKAGGRRWHRARGAAGATLDKTSKVNRQWQPLRSQADQPGIGRRRIRIRSSPMTTTAPTARSSAIWSRLARMMADCSAARRPASRRSQRQPIPRPLISLSALQDNPVRCSLHGKIPEVDSVMSRRLQAFGKERRQVVADEESHAVRRSGPGTQQLQEKRHVSPTLSQITPTGLGGGQPNRGRKALCTGSRAQAAIKRPLPRSEGALDLRTW
jgi:hypothetical protein